MKKKTKILLIILAIFTGISALYCTLNLKDYYHGFYADEYDIDEFKNNENFKKVEIDNDGVNITVRTNISRFEGFSIVVDNLNQTQGELVLEVYDLSSKLLIEKVIQIKDIKNEYWYKIYCDELLNSNEYYNVHIYSRNTKINPYMYFIFDSKNEKELNLSEAPVMFVPAYSYETFSYTERVMIDLLLWTTTLIILVIVIFNNKSIFKLIPFLIIIYITTWGFLFGTFNQKIDFFAFQQDSDQLVINTINSKMNGIPITKYGLTYKLEPELEPYDSQYGLHGKIMGFIARLTKYENIIDLYRIIIAMCCSTVFILISYFVGKKYNKLMMYIFMFVFCLSPWTSVFARNLYWVEFTWFLPMLFGLILSIYKDEKKYRLLSYSGIFLSILVKSLCGYEYISVIMMAAIMFPLADLLTLIISKKKLNKEICNLFKYIFVMGIMCLLGFLVAVTIHAVLRGEGSIISGIKSIIERDVMRRTNGGNLNNFDMFAWPSLNASINETLYIYFRFRTDVIPGIGADLFPIIAILPLIILIFDKKDREKLLSLYLITFITCVNWFILGKSHSFVHVILNYVLWYFGFIQVCLYIIISKIIEKIKK